MAACISACTPASHLPCRLCDHMLTAPFFVVLVPGHSAHSSEMRNALAAAAKAKATAEAKAAAEAE